MERINHKLLYNKLIENEQLFLDNFNIDINNLASKFKILSEEDFDMERNSFPLGLRKYNLIDKNINKYWNDFGSNFNLFNPHSFASLNNSIDIKFSKYFEDINCILNGTVYEDKIKYFRMETYSKFISFKSPLSVIFFYLNDDYYLSLLFIKSKWIYVVLDQKRELNSFTKQLNELLN